MQQVRVAQRWTVTEQHREWVQGGQTTNGLTVARRIHGEYPGRLSQPHARCRHSHVDENVSRDQQSVLSSPEAQMPGRMARRLQDLEAIEVISFLQVPRHWVCGAGEHAVFGRDHCITWHGQTKHTVLHCARFNGTGPQWNLTRATYRVR